MSDQSSQLWTLIDQARKLPVEERDPFLVAACADNLDLLAEARALLVLIDQNADLFTDDGGTTVPPDDLLTVISSPDPLPHTFESEAARCAERRPDGTFWIGPYQLVGLLGVGGFGAVFLAQRQEPIQFYVAIKVIQAGMASANVLRRFEQEREILASLDHPGIARVIDAGNTTRGVPFVAMEYVPGQPITQYCNRRQLTLEARLDLFREVCDAVQHAHQRGIIHRDLKPGNILVRDVVVSGTVAAAPAAPAASPLAANAANAAEPPTAPVSAVTPPPPTQAAARPIVKIIDWGIAKATQPLRTGLSLKTEGNLSPMTLQYASPEQAGAGGISPRDLDVRTDVFSLGVILYELLTGTRPISETDLRMAAQFEQLRLIREAERPRASTRLSELDRLTPAEESLLQQEAEATQRSFDEVKAEYLAAKRREAERIAAERKLGLDKLRQRLRGDLDSILRKSLELDRARRYDSPLSMASDIAAFLRGDAVPAHDAGTWYRFSKFVRRNRAAVAAVAAVFVAITAGGAVAAWKWQDELAARKREEIAKQKEAAAKQEAIAQRDAVTNLAEFVSIDLLEEPFNSDNAPLRVPVEVIDRARNALEVRFAAWPSLDALLSAALGRAYMAGGYVSNAEALLKRAKLRVDSGADVSEQVSENLVYDLAVASFRLHPDDTAIKIIEPLVRAREAQLGADADLDLSFAALLNVLGGAYKRNRQWSEAATVYERSLKIIMSKSGPPEQIFSLRTNILLVKLEQNRAAARDAKQRGDTLDTTRVTEEAKALELALRANADAASRSLGANHVEAIVPLIEAAALAGRLGDLEVSSRDFRQALGAMRSRERVQSWRMSETLARFGNLMLMNKEYAAAVPLLREALEGYLDPGIKGPDDPDSVTVSRWTASALENTGDSAGAVSVLERHYDLLVRLQATGNMAGGLACAIQEVYERSGNAEQAKKWAALCE